MNNGNSCNHRTLMTNYVLLIATAVFLVSIGYMITPSVSAQGITRVSTLSSGPEVGLDDEPMASSNDGKDTEEGDSGTTSDGEDTEPAGD
jgi:hypothetical protein